MDNKEPFPRLFNTLGRVGSILGVVGAVLLALSLGDLKTFMQAYLYGWMFWVSMTVGCLGWMLLQTLVRGSWGFPVLRLLEAGAKMMPIMGLAFLPIIYAANIHMLYPWADPSIVNGDPIVRWRAGWFNVGWFLLRNVVYFVVFTMFAYILPYLSREQDRTGDLKLIQNRTNLAAAGFVIMVLLATFAITDWVMSLDPHWYSTIYGFYFLICSGLSGLAFVTLLACILRITGVKPYADAGTPGSGLINRQLTRDLGNLLLTQTMVWAYFSLSQFLITWSGNLPNEIVFYVRRNQGLLSWVTAFLVTFQFFVPFLVLLSGRTKRVPILLAMVCTMILCVRVVEVAWNVIPMFHPLYGGLEAQMQGFVFYVAAFLGIGGWWIFGFVSHLRRSDLISLTDLAPVEAVHHAA